MLNHRDYMREPSHGGQWPMWGRLLIALAVIFFLDTALEFQSAIRKANWYATYLDWFALSLDGLKSGKIWQPLTFQFMHGGLWHLLGNSLIIFFFGRQIESNFGSKTFIRVYLIGGVVGGIVQIGLGLISPQFFGHPVIGASAGAFAILTAFCVLDLHARITLLIFFIPVAIPAWLLLVFQGAITLIGLIAPSERDIVAHGAHLGGMIVGYLWVRYYVRGNGWSSLPGFGKISLPTVVLKRGTRASGRQSARAPRTGIRVVKEETHDDLSDAEFISKKVDPILDKIREHGIHSLTDKERKILEKAQGKLSGK